MKKLILFLLSSVLILNSFGCTVSAAADGEDSNTHLHAFSFGKADAFLIWNSSGAVLIDTGNSGDGKEIAAYMEEQGITGLDVLIITHFDKDHVGGAAKVLKEVPVTAVFQSNYPKASDEYEKYCKALALNGIKAVTVREDTSFSLGEAFFDISAPKQETYGEEPSNNSSLITAVHVGETGFLFTGDSEAERLGEFLETMPGHFDVLEIPHHGRWIPQVDMLLKETTPYFAVITSSEEEPEDYMTTYHLKDSEIQILLTREGEIDISTDGKTLSLS